MLLSQLTSSLSRSSFALWRPEKPTVFFLISPGIAAAAAAAAAAAEPET